MEIKFVDRQTGKFITEHPPAEGLMRFIYENPVGRSLLLPLIRRKMVSSWYGRKMDHPSSAKKIPDFVKKLQIDMTESVTPIEDFVTFNDFFYRKLKPEARPIGSDFVSPGDGKLIAFEHIDDVNEFYVKGQRFDLNSFLQDKDLATKYQDGSMLILRLAPNDYHRYHFPSDGIASKTSIINGHYYSVSPIALVKNFTKVFCENKRAICTLETPNYGPILIMPVAATMVGSMVHTYQDETKVKKGDEMGYFKFGGSSIVLVIQKGKLVIDQDILDYSKKGIETFVKMGEKIGGQL